MSTSPSRKSMYAFLPSSVQRGNILLWLKRTHAWTGLFGALMFLFIGFTGILLNHRSVLKIDTGAPQVSSIEIVYEGEPFRNQFDFADWVRRTYDFAPEASAWKQEKEQRAQVNFEGRDETPAERWEMRFRGPNAMLIASYVPQANLIALERRENSVLGTLKELHKGHGVGLVWILLIDAIGGALVLMSLSGFLLWSKLHGPRLLALGLGGVTAVWFLVALWPQLIGGL